MSWRLPLLAALLLSTTTAFAADAPSATVPSAPHFMSLKIEGANGRRGPSATQPVIWIYQRMGLPLQVTGESGPWRRVRDPDGAEVWLQARNLDERRTAIVRGAHDVELRSGPNTGGRVIATMAPGVVGAVTGCEGEWRRFAVGGRVGWARANALWGADATCSEAG